MITSSLRADNPIDTAMTFANRQQRILFLNSSCREPTYRKLANVVEPGGFSFR